MAVVRSYSILEPSKHKDDGYAHLGQLGLGTPVAKGLWGRDFGVLGSATQALLAGFVRLY